LMHRKVSRNDNGPVGPVSVRGGDPKASSTKELLTQ